MKRRLLYKNKFRSKKGMTLVEILVGIAIIVIVFASTLGALVNGYSTTLYNADHNKEDLLNSSVNEIIFNTFKCMQISDTEEAVDVIDQIEDVQSSGDLTGDDYATALVVAISNNVDGAVFVPPEFSGGEYKPAFVDDVVFQYTIVPDVSPILEDPTPGIDDYNKITGFRILTSFETAKGTAVSESFIPYTG